MPNKSLKSLFIFLGRDLLQPSIPYKLQEELGYEVVFLNVPTDDKGNPHTLEDAYENMGLEIITEESAIKKYLLEKNAIVVVEDTLMTKWVKERIKKGYPTLCGYPEIEKWEDDRDYGMKICQQIEDYNNKHGNSFYNIHILPQEEFNDFDKAIQFVEANPKKWVIKEAGDSDIRALNYKGELDSGMDVIARLSYLREKGFGGEKKVHFFLQERSTGVEVAISGFFNGKDFLNWSEVDFEHQPLLAGDRGPHTGEMMNEAWGLEKDGNPLFNTVYPPLAPYLRKVGFHGFINLNGMMNERGYHPFEWTVRMAGSPWVTQLYEMLYGKTDYGELLQALAYGQDLHVQWNEGYTVGVRIDVPPSIFKGMSYDFLKKELADNKNLKGELQKSLSSPDTFIEKLHEFEQVRESSYEMPVIITDFHPEKARHFHWSDAKNLQIIYKDNIPYGIVEPTGSTFTYITIIGHKPKVINERLDAIVVSIAGLPFISRDDYCDEVEEKLSKLESWGWNLWPKSSLI